jgi:flagellar biogenesis protein FliO
MQNTRTDSPFRPRLGRAELSALVLALLAAPAANAAQTEGSRATSAATAGARPEANAGKPAANAGKPDANAGKPQAPTRSSRSLSPAAPTSTNTPVDTTAPATPAAPADPTPATIGTGGVVELTSLDPEPGPARDTVVIPTELEPGARVPPTVRQASAGRPLGKVAANDPAAATAADAAADRSLASGSEPSSALMGQVVPTALALGAVIAVIFIARALVKRFGNRLGGGKRPSGVVEVLARYPFARGHHIVLIKVGRRIIVTHQSAQGITTLSEFTSHAEVADLMARCEAGARGTEQFTFDSLLRSSEREFDAPALADRRSSAGSQRNDARSSLPASVRSAEIETIDLTRRRGVAR